jgi:translocator protein
MVAADPNAKRYSPMAGLILWLLPTFGAATLGAMPPPTRRSSMPSSFGPPGLHRPGSLVPRWTILYLPMTIAAWLVWRERGVRCAAIALKLFLIQFALNALWSWLFIARHVGGLAFAEVLVLWKLIVTTLIAHRRMRPLADWLLAPYLDWVAFATILCFSIRRLNPQLLGWGAAVSRRVAFPWDNSRQFRPNIARLFVAPVANRGCC